MKDALDIVYHRKVTDDISKVCPWMWLLETGSVTQHRFVLVLLFYHKRSLTFIKLQGDVLYINFESTFYNR